MNTEIYAKRRDKLRQKMDEKGIDALVVSASTNRYYLSGFELRDGQCNESSGYLIVTKSGKDLLCTDSRYELAAQKVWNEDRVRIYASDLAGFYNTLFKQENYKNIGFDEECLTYSFTKKAFDGLNITFAHGLIEELRVVKDAEEIKLMKISAALNHKLMAHLPIYIEENIHTGLTEKSIAWYIESYFRQHGATENAFAPIVAQDQHAALPHADPDDTIIKENSLLLVDVGARLGDYNSDQTRTFWIGSNPSDRFKTVLEQVQQAQQAAINILKPGITGKEAYDAAYNYFTKYNVEKFFTHGLGHGVGLQTHEAPRLTKVAETVLEPGMIVTVEPGLYYPEWGGVRWEYMMLITEDGSEIL